MIIADMHTHSSNSHDSSCDMENMILSQLEKGTGVLAVTDHFDTAWFSIKDVITPVVNSNKQAAELKEKYKDKISVLAGVEVSETFWKPQIYERLKGLTRFDVIIGSVHCVRYKDLTMPYAQLDFSKLSRADLEGFMDAYFNDMLTMLETLDFDILAHLTCPLRYIRGKYLLDFDLDGYMGKIEQILKKIIEKGIALEINTSSYDTLGDFMPSVDIIKLYYDLGGRMITLGSDAHIAENASKNFCEAIKTIESIGFDGIYYLENRAAKKINLKTL